MSPAARSLLLRLAATGAVFLGLAVFRLVDNSALLPNPLTVDLELGPGDVPRSDPLIVAGEHGRGDFLTVRIRDAQTITFVYDSWAYAGITSQPVRVQPGARLRLRIAMPALDHVRMDTVPSSNRARVSVDGVTVLDTEVHSYPRDPERIFIAENPIGGTACGTVLRGRVFDENGRDLRGPPNIDFTVKSRVRRFCTLFGRWSQHQPAQLLAMLLISLGLVFGAARLFARGLTPRAIARGLGRHRWFAGAALIATLGFTWVVTLGTWRFNEREVFGNFYDFQAASLLAGRLDVPDEAIGGEAFEAKGKVYGYFGPTPALLRLPFIAAGLAFGKLSRAYMVLYFVASLAAAYLLLREARRLQRGTPEAPEADDIPSPFSTCVLVASAGWGSTIFFLGSRGLIFHEAILGGIALALWSSWCSLRHLRTPGTRWWLGALVFGVLSIHTRPPTGLFALTLLGCVSVFLAMREHRAHATAAGRWRFLRPSLRRHATVGVLCAAGALSLNGLAYLKFGLFDAAPLRISRPYKVPGRLEHIDGKSFHTANVPYGFYTYVIRPNFRVERGFPWIYLGSPKLGHLFPKAKIDLPDHTLAISSSMPSLFALATLGGLGALFFSPGLRPALALLGLAALPMSFALFAAVATAQRYTGDFCPPLIAAAACALAALEAARPCWRRLWQPLIVATSLAAVAVTVALTIHYQGETLWGVPEETRVNYRHLRQSVDHFFGVVPPPKQP